MTRNDLGMTWFDLYNNLFQRLAFLLVHSALSVYSATTRFTETVDSIILIENQLKQNDSIYSLNDQITTQENGPTRKYFFDFVDFFVDNRKVQPPDFWSILTKVLSIPAKWVCSTQSTFERIPMK